MRQLISTVALVAIATLFCWGSAPSSGSVTCPSSGNKALLSVSTRVLFYSLYTPGIATANTGFVCIGSSSVTTGSGICFDKGVYYSVPSVSNTSPYDLSQLYIACTVNTDTIRYLYY